jgi:hypothetical protein
MKFYDKLKWVLGILLIFILILATNLIDRKSFIRVKDSVSAIYEDRLVADNLIFEMLKSVQEKQLAVALGDSMFYKTRNSLVNEDIEGYIEIFEATSLTKTEDVVFGNLKSNISRLKTAETIFVQNNFSNKLGLLNEVDKIKENLNDLAAIQLSEGGRQMSISKTAINTVEIYTQIEIYFLITLAIIIQIIVMYKPKGSDSKI